MDIPLGDGLIFCCDGCVRPRSVTFGCATRQRSKPTLGIAHRNPGGRADFNYAKFARLHLPIKGRVGYLITRFELRYRQQFLLHYSAPVPAARQVLRGDSWHGNGWQRTQ
jgi:hypothetical protein